MMKIRDMVIIVFIVGFALIGYFNFILPKESQRLTWSDLRAMPDSLAAWNYIIPIQSGEVDSIIDYPDTQVIYFHVWRSR